ncbi:MAG: PKD domain-containing protein [Pseudomonadota bacterium]
MILDAVTSTDEIPPYTSCPLTFQAGGNYTDIVFINRTIGNIGTDVRIDNVCLTSTVCPQQPSCSYVNANYSYVVSTGTTVNFTDLSTLNPGDVPTYTWDFGDPTSGVVNNTSNLASPTHVYTSAGGYVACLYLSVLMTNGLTCTDTFCLDVIVQEPNGITNNSNDIQIAIFLNPVINQLYFIGNLNVTEIELVNLQGQKVIDLMVNDNKAKLQFDLANGLYFAILHSIKGIIYRKILIGN